MKPVEPPEPARPATSLEISFEPDVDVPAASPELALPSPATAPEPPPVEPEIRAERGPLGDLVAAHFQRVEIALLGRVLITTLGGALPPSMVRVRRRRSLARRLIGRPGEPVGITVTLGDRMLSFYSPEIGVAEASVGHLVRGVVLSTSPVPVSEWLDELAVLLNDVTRDDQATRLALENALLH
jgi:hypothetical protein